MVGCSDVPSSLAHSSIFYLKGDTMDDVFGVEGPVVGQKGDIERH